MAPDRYELRPDARRFETWENNYAARLGLGVAVDYALAVGLAAIEARAGRWPALLRDGLRAIRGVTVHDLGRNPAPSSPSRSPASRRTTSRRACTGAGINVSTSRPSSTLLDATARRLPPVVRASPHYYNSEEEIERLLAVLRTGVAL